MRPTGAEQAGAEQAGAAQAGTAQAGTQGAADQGVVATTVNGTPTTVDEAAGLSAAEALRDRLGLTGTKRACGTGACGSCAILLDGKPVAGCLTPCEALSEREVTTVEGLARQKAGGVHPVQRAFAAHDGLQCGYCTPGFVVAASAFVDAWRAEHGDVEPERDVIAAALAGHLCRCGAYPGIYRAVAAACTGAHDEDTAEPVRVEAMEKVTGRAVYSADVRLDGMLEGAIVRSTEPHALIGAVTAPDGVPLVELLPQDRVVRYVGQPIAAVAAPTAAGARAAAATVEVAYEPRPAVITTEDAVRPGAPLVYPTPEERKHPASSAEGVPGAGRWDGNQFRQRAMMTWRGRTADRRIAAAAQAGSDRLVTGTFSTAVQMHSPMEPHACVAHWEGEDLHLYVSTAVVSMIPEVAAKRFKLPKERVHVHADHVGGAFGAKGALHADALAAAELARLHGAPVRVVFGRDEELTDAGHRPGTRIELAMLTDDDGKLSALRMNIESDGGVAVGANSAGHARFMYGTAPRRLRDVDVVTNRPPAAPFRGPGAPPTLWALEQAVDETAHRLRVDPIRLRQRWDGNPKRAVLYREAAATKLWEGRPAAGSQSGRYRRGVGVAAAGWLYLLDPKAQVELVVRDGVVVARTGTQDIGTGIRSVIADVVSEELGIPADKVEVEIGHSDGPYGTGSFGSRTTTSIAPAAREAAAELRGELAGRDPDVEKALKTADGLSANGRRRRDRRGYVMAIPGQPIAIGRGFSGAVHVTEVEVDTLLGQVRVLRVWGGVAAGRVYNERTARSQCEGGIVQGIGYALYEQRHIDPATGVNLTDNLDDYRLPGIADTPEINLYFHTGGFEHATGGGIGLGEVSTIGVAASIGNAVHNATGVRQYDLPIRPDRLREGIGSWPHPPRE